jgi:hypothetical protein
MTTEFFVYHDSAISAKVGHGIIGKLLRRRHGQHAGSCYLLKSAVRERANFNHIQQKIQENNCKIMYSSI